MPQASVDQPADGAWIQPKKPASKAPGKRPHDQTSSSEPHQDNGGGDEPLTKAPGVRRAAVCSSASLCQAPLPAAAAGSVVWVWLAAAIGSIERAERSLATAVRDFACAAIREDSAHGAATTGVREPSVWATGALDSVEVVTSAPEEPYEVLAPLTPPHTEERNPPQGTASCTGPANDAGAASGAARARRGRRRTADHHLEYFEKQLALEAEMREREAALDERRLSIEERRLAIRELELQQRMRVFEAAQEEWRQKRAALLQQSQLLANAFTHLSTGCKSNRCVKYHFFKRTPFSCKLL
ncbi:hypothetical protein HPB51_008736 [Rhipicephalus microplus]|uniref:Uncharacterized protein n=1 Tax=Rhipicephalus microplus TaxID=6941 RepID=A0A9J6DFL3_RHIMP|nr:hypothetical protein HPB51_008736 [Rhipicephalus microplus]